MHTQLVRQLVPQRAEKPNERGETPRGKDTLYDPAEYWRFGGTLINLLADNPTAALHMEEEASVSLELERNLVPPRLGIESRSTPLLFLKVIIQ